MNYRSFFISLVFSIAVTKSVDTSAQRPVPAAYPAGTNINFVRTWDATAPEQDGNTLVTRPLKDVKMATQYMDGLGRPLQTVIKQGSLVTGGSGATDLVSPVEYDEFGRPRFQYLPYAESSSADGSFKTNPFAAQATFMNAQYGIPQGDSWYYGQTDYEASPLNRVLKTMAPGNNWVGAGRGTSMQYAINTALDEVRIWNVTNQPNTFGMYASSGTYPAGSLFKNISTDERGYQVIEFKDKDGKVILKKVQLTAAADNPVIGSNHDGWLCTYYLYDDLNNLRCVIQPRGVELISPSWVLTNAVILSEQCFRYEYDSRNRMIRKQVPGAGYVEMVYDARDRLVITQDAAMRTAAIPKFLYTQYDELNRPVATGIYEWAYNTMSDYQVAAADKTDFPWNYFGTAIAPEILTNTFYDNYNWQSTYTTGLAAGYDDSFDTYFEPVSNTVWPYGQSNTASAMLKGMVTGSRTKVLGTTTWLYTAVYYDAKGRAIQNKSTNHLGGVDILTTQYTWSGQPLITVLKTNISGINAQTSVAISRMTYDDLGRMIKTEKKIKNTQVNSNSLPGYSTISTLAYNASGQLKSKKLGSKPTSEGWLNPELVKQEYEYNIRGWLLSANKSYLTSPTNSDQYFGYELGYDKNASLGTFTAQYNGNISGTIWKSEGDQQKRKYDFTYDPVNRLMSADFNQYTGSSFNKTANVDFSMKMGDGSTYTSAYDANGNIKQLQQWGLLVNTSGQIDNLRYTYNTNSNKLKSVKDFNNDPTTKLGDFKTSTTHPQNSTKAALTTSSTQAQFDAITDYTYDVNGNLVLDNNKDIGTIGYNYLNLPQNITVTSKGSIAYTYDAGGNKLKKVTIENPSAGNGNKTITTTTNYINGLVYESKTTSPANTPGDDYSDVLQFLPQEEGRVRFKPGTTPALFYDYFLKDHLGNVRMVLTEEKPQNVYPAATMEGTFGSSANSMVNYESQFYKIDNTKIVSESAIPSWGTESVANTKLYYNYNTSPPGNPSYPAGCTPTQTDGSSKLYKLNATTNKTGLEFVMKVMAGDYIDIMGKSYYLNTTNITNANSTTLDVLGLMTNFLTAPANAAAGKGFTAGILNSANSGVIPNSFFRGNNSEPTTTIPKAYINYIFFDEQFNYKSGGFSRVGATSGSVWDHWQNDPALQNLVAPKNGYIFVYVSNESNVDVFFDNLQVIHKPGPILEETHYYPFGLTMAGISSKAAGKLENKRKWNSGSELESKEFSDGSGLELYSTKYRNLDPQLGRFWQIDPKPDYSQSLYSSMNNNPIRFNDPLGDSIIGDANTKVADRIVNKANNNIQSNNTKIANNNKAIQDARDALASGKLDEKGVKKANNTINNLTNKNSELVNRNAELNRGISAINAMKADVDHNYSFRSPANNDGTHHVVRGTGKNVIVEGSDNGLYLHESIHILQGLNSGGLQFSTSTDNLGKLLNVGATGSHIGDEVQAYQVQFSFDGTFSTSRASNLSDINPESVRDLHNDDVYPYRNL